MSGRKREKISALEEMVPGLHTVGATGVMAVEMVKEAEVSDLEIKGITAMAEEFTMEWECILLAGLWLMAGWIL